MIPTMTLSTFMYCKEQGSLGMPLLMLWPTGLDKSKISYHFPCWYFFGVTPKKLTWRFGIGDIAWGPATWPFWSSVKRYWSITAGWSAADGMFWVADLNDTAKGSKPRKKTTSSTRNHKIHFSLIRMKTKFLPQFVCTSGCNSKRRDQILLKSTSNGMPCGLWWSIDHLNAAGICTKMR